MTVLKMRSTSEAHLQLSRSVTIATKKGSLKMQNKLRSDETKEKIIQGTLMSETLIIIEGLLKGYLV